MRLFIRHFVHGYFFGNNGFDFDVRGLVKLFLGYTIEYRWHKWHKNIVYIFTYHPMLLWNVHLKLQSHVSTILSSSFSRAWFLWRKTLCTTRRLLELSLYLLQKVLWQRIYALWTWDLRLKVKQNAWLSKLKFRKKHVRHWTNSGFNFKKDGKYLMVFVLVSLRSHCPLLTFHFFITCPI